MRYLVVIEQGESSWGAYVPNLPGRVAAGETREGVAELIREAISFHIEGMRDAGEDIPPPRSHGELVETPTSAAE